MTDYDSMLEGSVEVYSRAVGKLPLLTREEEVRAAERIREGDRESLETLVDGNRRFVISVAKRYVDQGLSYQELIEEGNDGLYKAAQRFDETKGFRFISYAVWWIRQAILQGLLEGKRQQGPTRIVEPANEIGNYTTPDVQRSLLVLDDQEREVVVRYYGLGADDAQSLDSVAKHLGIEPDDVRRLKEKALSKMRTASDYQ